jgi:hypothetical protein
MTVGRNEENMLNEKGNTLINFAAYSALTITVSFFKYNNIHKLTWTGKGYKSIIDYVFVNKKLSPQIDDISISYL